MQRLDAVEEHDQTSSPRGVCGDALEGVLDLERLLSRVTLETANPRDVAGLGASLAQTAQRRAVTGAHSVPSACGTLAFAPCDELTT